MKIKRSIALFAVILLLSLGVAVPAVAMPATEVSPAPRPLVMWYELTEIRSDGTETLVNCGTDLSQVKTVVPNVGILAEVPGSKSVTYCLSTKNWLRQTLYKMYNKLTWRWDSSYRCYLISRSGWGEAIRGGWSYVGLIGNQWWGTGTNKITSRYQGKFHYSGSWIPWDPPYDMYSGVEVQGWTGGDSVANTYK